MNDDYYAEEALDKPYDARLMRRLLGYARPYRAIIGLCLLLIAASAAFDVSLPYLTKLAIDRYIAKASKIISFTDSTMMQRFLARYGSLLVAISEHECLIDAGKTNKLLAADLKLFRESGMLGRKRYYPIVRKSYSAKQWEQVRRLCERKGFRRVDAGFLAGTSELGGLSESELSAIRSADKLGLLRLGILFFGILALNFLVSYAQVYLMNYTSQRVLFDLRLSLFDRVQRLPLSFFDKTPVGRLVTRTTNDIVTLNEMFSGVLVYLFKDALLVVGIAGVLLYMSWRLALVTFAVLPLVLYSAWVFRKRARDAYRRIRIKIARLNASFNEFITGISVIRAFSQEKRIGSKFAQVNHDVFLARKRQILVFAVFRPFMDVLRFGAIALIIWYGGRCVISNVVSLGVFVAFISYIGMFFRPINDLTEKYDIIQAAMASSERIFQLMDKQPEPSVALSPPKNLSTGSTIEFENVWFAYDSDNWVLKDVSFRINAGETVAIVGATGAGKTTIIGLLSRLYPIQRGRILLDGTDIAQIPLQRLRRIVGVVHQDTFLFSTTIGGNVKLGSGSIDEETVWRSIEAARAEKLVKRLPKKLDEPVMERGATLSAGERQLLAFARALAFDPDILVLDEATSNVDPETESLIQEALQNLTKGRTCLIVAHRLSTIQNADRILVLHKGVLREQGRHEELLANRGIYYDLYCLQYT